MVSCSVNSVNDPTRETNDELLKQHKNVPKRLKCSVHNYDWGIVGKNSQVARLFSLNSGSDIDPGKPYAEFWIGTHKSGPSFVDHGNGNGSLSLKKWILENPYKVLGDKVMKKWGGDLPFLFKVISVGKALSIQAHPDKELAKALHKAQPSIYKDDNHKPEMALALTEFEALCGFISVKELKNMLCTFPEIVELVGDSNVKQFLHMNEQDRDDKGKTFLQSIFSQIVLSSSDEICELISNMKRRLHLEMQERELTDKEWLVLRLESQYPADVGVMAAFLLNYVKLSPGEALYLEANEPHAYVGGECIECMANSDNVVRAGLTPKQRDVQTLLSMLKYRQGFPEILRGVPLSPFTTRYRPPLDEFEVDLSILPEAASVVFPSIPGPSLFLIIMGRGTIDAGFCDGKIVKEGEAYFVPAYTEIRITAKSTKLHLYRAGVNSRFLKDSSI
ncbi:mannose-6-phosphate isomerase, putative [Ricinus communis]|uniref:mannose-6-phosphate isomerase n=1 Tax=Ricinus communis TaxID=3988 RepID=B9SLX4_RICCO|nr:mannose-6-phosphate isomerase, putative [Ricinus communis]|eukprot:XP_002526993.1 mannose-6-phosphate isomerase 1 [Ricinus communis]